MLYRFLNCLILMMYGLLTVCCQQKTQSQIPSNVVTVPTSDSIYSIDLSNTSFRQAIGAKEKIEEKKFVRITVKEIVNPAQVAISFDLYYVEGEKKEMLGSVAPFPANNPGSYIIATSGKIRTQGLLELNLRYPGDWNKNDKLSLKINPLTLE